MREVKHWGVFAKGIKVFVVGLLLLFGQKRRGRCVEVYFVPKPGSDKAKHYRCHPSYGHNTKDCWALKDKIEELIQTGYLAQFVKRPNHNPVGARPRGHQDDHHRSQDEDQRKNRVEESGQQRRHQQRR